VKGGKGKMGKMGKMREMREIGENLQMTSDEKRLKIYQNFIEDQYHS